MKNDNIQEKIKEIFAKTEDKNEAVIQAMTLIAEKNNEGLIERIQEEARRAAADAAYAESLGLHTPTAAEEKFYNILRSGDIKQAITANQIDIIPEETIDRTLDSVKKASDVLTIVDFAPANVKKWVIASHTGSAVWGELTNALDRTKDLTATISTVNMELGKLWALLIIPKAVQDLALPFVDRYFTAILADAMQDGLENGFLNGKGQTVAEPIGILQKISAPTTAKTKLTNVTELNPVGLAGV
jgi:HK97 family phage major capsid protein